MRTTAESYQRTGGDATSYLDASSGCRDKKTMKNQTIIKTPDRWEPKIGTRGTTVKIACVPNIVVLFRFHLAFPMQFAIIVLILLNNFFILKNRIPWVRILYFSRRAVPDGRGGA
jgi:hypothetical protein